jgi:hypothetical protein
MMKAARLFQLTEGNLKRDYIRARFRIKPGREKTIQEFSLDQPDEPICTTVTLRMGTRPDETWPLPMTHLLELATAVPPPSCITLDKR